MASKLAGVYKMESTENFDEFMKELGVNIALRKIGNMGKPTVTIKLDGNDFDLKSESTLKTIIIKCTIGQEFEENSPDGRKCKSIMKWDGNKLLHTQSGDGKTVNMVRYIDDQDRLVITFECNGIVGTRIYKRV